MSSETSFGIWVKRRRKALDLTQQELAKRVGCSVSLIFKIESDERRPSRQMAELLSRHLEISPEQRELFLKIARQERAVHGLESLSLPSGPAPAPLPQPSQSNLPLSPTPLFGREHELRAIIQQIKDPACRLLTLTGPGGVGKTRLALEIAHQLRDAFKHGVWFVPLVGTSSSEFIIPAIADSLGFVFSGAADLKVQLIRFLKEKQILLVLDNLEHLLDGIGVVGEILENAPGLKLLATSREQLNLRAEWVVDVQGLPYPSDMDGKDLESNSAAALFLQRARQINLSFTPTPEDVRAIQHICQLVEGLPLGLELAATWVRVMSVSEIAQEIDQNRDFLSTTVRDVPERHRSIRMVFDHSWNLLLEAERKVMQRLSVFRGGFTRQAAEQVAGATLPLLSSLVEKSLVRRHESGRFDLHELIRQYAAVRLQEEAQEEFAIRNRHSIYYLHLLQSYQPALTSDRQKDAITNLGAEIDNLRVAWDTSINIRLTDSMHGALPALWRFYDVQNYCQEGVALFSRGGEMVEQLLASLDAVDKTREDTRLKGILGDLLAYKAYFIRRLGRNIESAMLYQSSLALLRPLNEPAALSHVLVDYGALCCFMGEFKQAWDCLNESLPLLQGAGNEWQEARCLALLGLVAHEQGNYSEASRLLQNSMKYFYELGDPRYIAVTTNFYSRTMHTLGQIIEVQDLLREGLRLATETGDQLGIGMMLEGMALVEQVAGDEAHARHLFDESVECFRNINDLWSLSRALNLKGYFHLAIGEKMQARDNFKEACRVASISQAKPGMLDALTGLAMWNAQVGDEQQALEHVIHVLHQPASPQEVKNRARNVQVELEARLLPEKIRMVKARVQDKTLEALMQEILV